MIISTNHALFMGPDIFSMYASSSPEPSTHTHRQAEQSRAQIRHDTASTCCMRRACATTVVGPGLPSPVHTALRRPHVLRHRRQGHRGRELSLPAKSPPAMDSSPWSTPTRPSSAPIDPEASFPTVH